MNLRFIEDIGAVVHVLRANEAFIVEAVNADNYIIFGADFQAEELSLLVESNAIA